MQTQQALRSNVTSLLAGGGLSPRLRRLAFLNQTSALFCPSTAVLAILSLRPILQHRLLLLPDLALRQRPAEVMQEISSALGLRPDPVLAVNRSVLSQAGLFGTVGGSEHTLLLPLAATPSLRWLDVSPALLDAV
jgi:hypothetical protein